MGWTTHLRLRKGHWETLRAVHSNGPEDTTHIAIAMGHSTSWVRQRLHVLRVRGLVVDQFMGDGKPLR